LEFAPQTSKITVLQIEKLRRNDFNGTIKKIGGGGGKIPIPKLKI